LTAVFAAALLLFVVVCPFTPTPNAVIRSDHSAPSAPQLVIAVLSLASPALLAFSFISLQQVAETHDPRPPLSVLSRTCVQLC